MSIPALEIPYTYLGQSGFTIQGLEGDQAVVPNNSTIESIYNKYASLFGETDGVYTKALGSILSQLKTLFEQSSDITIENIDNLLTTSQKINGQSIESVCREGYMALRYYLQTIIDKAKTMNTYIQQARAALSDLAVLSGTNEQINDKAHELITKLQICDKFSHEIFQDFKRYYQFDNDTKLWNEKFKKSISIDESLLKDFSLSDANGLKKLRELQIPYHDSNVSGGYSTSAIKTFNSLPLMDRLRYIRYYYKLIIQYGATDYSVFPDDAELGFPCIPNEVAKEGEDQKSRGGMELFYLGYLIDRDGPINAISSFLEVKTQALRANLQLSSTQISSLNVYLEFVNAGLDLLNKSQSGNSTNKRIPEGVGIAVAAILGSNMYNIFEDDNGIKCLVIPSQPIHNPSTFFLVQADDSGIRDLIKANDPGAMTWDVKTLYVPGTENRASKDEHVSIINERSSAFVASPNPSYYFSDSGKQNIAGAFKLPTKLDVQAISTVSLKGFIGCDDWYTNDGSKVTTDIISSWTDAFTNKTKYINTAIDTINTDVQVDRNKIDSLDSMCSTFRSRAHDTYSNVASNIR